MSPVSFGVTEKTTVATEETHASKIKEPEAKKIDVRDKQVYRKNTVTKRKQEKNRTSKVQKHLLFQTFHLKIIIKPGDTVTEKDLPQVNHVLAEGMTGIFSVYLRGRLWAPVPMQNTLIFSQFDKIIPNQKMNFSCFQ